MIRFNDSRDWFFDKPFGMFVHWGLYAIPAWHEQILWRKGQDRREYEKLMHEFNPTGFDPDAWLDLARSAGMEFITITTKHHDGFCLWDTAYTDFNIMHTPYGRDVVADLAEACHRRDFPLRFYYSVADWHHPNYPNRGKSGVSHELPEPLPGDEPDENKYIDFAVNQVRELCTKYGEIHGIWWDVNRLTYRDLRINRMIHELQPCAVINDRGFSAGDFITSERDYQADDLSATRAFHEPIEACQSVGMESWGFRENENYYTAKYLQQSIDRMMARGATYLLNVGPRADGTIADNDVRLLHEIGAWFRRIRESLVGAQPCSHLTANQDVLLTASGNTLYVHLYNEPRSTTVVLDPIKVLPKRCTLLNNGEPLPASLDDIPRLFKLGHEVLCVRELPTSLMQQEVLVLKLEFNDLSELQSPGQTGSAEFEG